MAKKRVRVTTYYLKPTGNVAHSNGILSQNLGEENFMQDVPCKGGKRHSLWRCPEGMALMIWNSRANFSCLGKKFSVRVFSQEGNGQIRDVTEWYRRRHQKQERRPDAKF